VNRLTVDVGAVGGPEILDHDLAVIESLEASVAGRDLLVAAQPRDAFLPAPDGELVVQQRDLAPRR
jgi:hypothetical protein